MLTRPTSYSEWRKSGTVNAIDPSGRRIVLTVETEVHVTYYDGSQIPHEQKGKVRLIGPDGEAVMISLDRSIKMRHNWTHGFINLILEGPIPTD